MFTAFLRGPTPFFKGFTAIRYTKVFKILNGIYDAHATIGMMELNTQSNTRGHNKKQSCRLNVRNYSLTSRVVDIWNSLSEEIIVAKTF